MPIRCLRCLVLVLILTSSLPGCGHLLDREDRLRVHNADNGQIGINITTATRRLAIVHPSGRTCSELSPPAVIEADRKRKANATARKDAVGELSGGFEGESQETAVKLLETTERIECLRIALFHACGIAAQQTDISVAEEQELLLGTIEECGNWEAVPSAEETTPEAEDVSTGES